MYTNDVDNGNYEEQNAEVEKSSSNNGLKILIIVILAIIAIGLIIFALAKGKGSSKSDNYTITVYPESIVVPYGGSKNVSYEVRNNNEVVTNATVRLKSEDETIAKVDNLIVTGVNYGKTILTVIYVTDSGKTIQDLKEVTVADGEPGVVLESVTFPEGDLQMAPDGTYDIQLTTEPYNGYIESKKITSSNNNVVMVDEKGTITAVGEGEATITINVNNGAFKKVMKVFVSKNNVQSELVVSPTDITIEDAAPTLVEGNTSLLKYSVTPSNASGKVTWASSDSNVLIVNENGKVTALKEGLATITVTTFNGISNGVTIQVVKKEVPVTEISLSIEELSLDVGSSQIIIPTVLPQDATDKTLTYESSDTSVAIVTRNEDSSATITGVSAGNSTIIIKSSNGMEKFVNVTVVGSTEPDPSSSGGGGGGGSSCKKTCPDGQYVKNCKCVQCEAGYYCKNGKRNQCSSDYTSKAGASSCTRTKCPAGQGLDPSATTGCSACASGYYSPAGSGQCTKCPSDMKSNATKSACEYICNISNCSIYKSRTASSCVCATCKSGYTSYNGGYTCSSKTEKRACASYGTSTSCLSAKWNGKSYCKWDYTYGCQNA